MCGFASSSQPRHSISQHQDRSAVCSVSHTRERLCVSAFAAWPHEGKVGVVWSVRGVWRGGGVVVAVEVERSKGRRGGGQVVVWAWWLSGAGRGGRRRRRGGGGVGNGLRVGDALCCRDSDFLHTSRFQDVFCTGSCVCQYSILPRSRVVFYVLSESLRNFVQGHLRCLWCSTLRTDSCTVLLAVVSACGWCFQCSTQRVFLAPQSHTASRSSDFFVCSLFLFVLSRSL